MDNLTAVQLFHQAFHFYSYNSSHIIPGLYDVKEADASWILTATLVFFTMQVYFHLNYSRHFFWLD